MIKPLKCVLIEVSRSLSSRLASVCFLLLLAWAVCAQQPPSLSSGKDHFLFSDWAGPDLQVWTYQPSHFTANTPIVFVMHGTKRDGKRYRDEWVVLAEQHQLMVVVPEFPKANFPGSRGYNLGNVLLKSKQANRREHWSFAAIEPLFDDIKKRSGSQQSSYSIYGHSAGSQFVHRFLYFTPEARVKQAIAANAGWYTMPNFVDEFPYGLRQAPLQKQQLIKALQHNLVILLGTEDTNTQSKTLRRTPEALSQGPHRLARGQTYYAAAERAAQSLQTPFNWQLKYAPGVGHKNALIAAFAAPLLAK